MREYQPLLFVGAAIGIFSIAFIIAYALIKDKKAAVKASTAASAVAPAAAAPVQQEELAPGSAGQLKLYDVPPKTAAMIMAIVANQMGKPLNELRFISIKEVK